MKGAESHYVQFKIVLWRISNGNLWKNKCKSGGQIKIKEINIWFSYCDQFIRGGQKIFLGELQCKKPMCLKTNVKHRKVSDFENIYTAI